MQNAKKHRIKLGRRTAELLDLPQEAFTGEVKVVLYANTALVAENHEGVFECLPERIRLKTREGILCVKGSQMTLMELSAHRALIEGHITGAEFEK